MTTKIGITVAKSTIIGYFRGLKRLIPYIILTCLLFDTTPLYQLVKLPSLIQHFTEHKTLNQEISFLDFLSMHYWGDDMDDDDDEKDMQLPFKKFEIQHVSFIFIPGTTNAFTFKSPTWSLKPDYGLASPQIYYSTTLGSLFRPPRA
jgi:hypothetical protein